MFKKSERLSVAEFASYFKRGARTHFKIATVVTAPLPTSGRKCAVVVGKKVSKKAVVRNQIRRRVYAQLRTELQEAFNGVCIVLIKPAYKSLTKAQSHAEISKIIASVAKST